MPRFSPVRRRSVPALALIMAVLALAGSGTRAQDVGSRTPEEAAYLERFRQGMPADSLYWLLAGLALRRLSFDTAMAFNLTIETPPPGAFRDSVLRQRYRLYVLAGLHDDATALKDSLPAAFTAIRPRRHSGWEVKAFSGYGREDQGAARVYPIGVELEELRSEGWLARHRGAVTFPLPSPASMPFSLALGYGLAKSYYKDSLDYRAEARLSADRILDGLSAALTAEGGRIAGVGPVAAFKAEATYLVLGGGGFLIANAGYESEWEAPESRRYDAGWLSLFREWGMAGGRAVHATASATWLRMDPLRLPASHPAIFVEDAAQESPTHYRDGTYRDTLSRSRFTAYQLYTGAAGALEFRCPQDAITLSPGAGFSFPAGLGLTANLSAGYAWTWYPSPYRWLETASGDPFAGDSATFHGFARSRVDGRYYAASLDNRGGTLRESYGTEPLEEREETRVDHRLQGGLTLKRGLGGLGNLALDLGVQRTFSTLEGEAPLWLPGWEFDASVRWSLAGAWR